MWKLQNFGQYILRYPKLWVSSEITGQGLHCKCILIQKCRNITEIFYVDYRKEVYRQISVPCTVLHCPHNVFACAINFGPVSVLRLSYYGLALSVRWSSIYWIKNISTIFDVKKTRGHHFPKRYFRVLQSDCSLWICQSSRMPLMFLPPIVLSILSEIKHITIT